MAAPRGFLSRVGPKGSNSCWIAWRRFLCFSKFCVVIHLDGLWKLVKYISCHFIHITMYLKVEHLWHSWEDMGTRDMLICLILIKTSLKGVPRKWEAREDNLIPKCPRSQEVVVSDFRRYISQRKFSSSSCSSACTLKQLRFVPSRA